MRAQPTLFVVSDLHRDGGPYEWPAAAQEADVVVVAGDSQSGAFDSEFFSKLGKPVVVVPGNHDFWTTEGTDMFEVYAAMKRAAQGTEVHVLWDETVVLAGARFIGTPLWTDFGGGNKELMRASFAHSRDYEYINAKSWYADPENMKLHLAGGTRFRLHEKPDAAETGAFTPIVAYALHRKSRCFIEAELAEPFDGPTVLVTHMAPTYASLRLSGTTREFHLDPNHWQCHGLDNRELARVAGYASDLSAIFTRYRNVLDLAIHGHIHASLDFVEGSTRVVANPRGRYSGPLTQKQAESLLFQGYRATPADIAASEERFRQYPYWGDNPEFEPEKLVRLSDGLAPAVALVVDEALPRLHELYGEILELAPHVVNEVPVVARSIQESVTVRAEEFHQELSKLALYAADAFDVKSSFNRENSWSEYAGYFGAPRTMYGVLPRFRKMFGNEPDADVMLGHALATMAALLEFLPTLPQTAERMRARYAERIQKVQELVQAAGYSAPVEAYVPVDFWRKLYQDIGSITIAGPADVVQKLHLEADKIVNDGAPRRSAYLGLHARGAPEYGMHEKRGEW